MTEVFQWDDGHIFVVLDRDIGGGCVPCSVKNRGAFHKNDNEKFLMAAALTAHATGRKVYVRVDQTCTIHGNTPRLLALSVKGS